MKTRTCRNGKRDSPIERRKLGESTRASLVVWLEISVIIVWLIELPESSHDLLEVPSDDGLVATGAGTKGAICGREEGERGEPSMEELAWREPC
jgi:hypothetical protein